MPATASTRGEYDADGEQAQRTMRDHDCTPVPL